jgi:hypothetical protein
VQIGRVPPTFGAYTRTVYAYENVVFGQPLAYLYLLSLKPTAVPATADDLLRMRGRGWLSDFPVGQTTPSPGVPIVDTARFDTGVQIHGQAGIIAWTGAVTAGSLSEPRLDDNNSRPQVAGRVVARAGPAIRFGGSVATAAWLDSALDAVLPDRAREHRQSAVALDLEVSRGAWLGRTEWLRSTWSLPRLGVPAIAAPVVAQSLILEGRYRLLPGVTLAARGDALWFSDVRGSSVAASWEANLRRLEAGLGVAVTRNVTAKAAWQHNRRDGGRVRRDSLLAAHLVYWF